MTNKEIIQLLLLLVGVTITVKGQTVGNTGIMHIAPGTIVGVVSDFNNQGTGTLWNDGELYLFSNFNNDGLVSFTPNEKGNTRFEGKAKQTITGSLPADFQNVLLNNNSAEPTIELYNEISVAGDANFSHGIVTNEVERGMMVFEKDATHSNTSNESYVDGYVKKNGANEFVYPVGNKGFLRHSKIEATNDALSSFTSRYFYENSDSLYPHINKSGIIEAINDKEYWMLEKTNGIANAILTLSWDETTTPEDIVVSPEESLHIVSWDTAQNLWVDQGGIVDTANRTVTTPIGVTGSTVFTLARVKDKIIRPCNNLVIYNAVSPNGDGINDFFRIDGLESCSQGSNSVQIFNRWGVKVFEADNYGANGNVFKGYSEGRTTISKGSLLPSGTYFYVINLQSKEANSSSQMIKKSGYLYIN